MRSIQALPHHRPVVLNVGLDDTKLPLKPIKPSDSDYKTPDKGA